MFKRRSENTTASGKHRPLHHPHHPDEDSRQNNYHNDNEYSYNSYGQPPVRGNKNRHRSHHHRHGSDSPISSVSSTYSEERERREMETNQDALHPPDMVDPGAHDDRYGFPHHPGARPAKSNLILYIIAIFLPPVPVFLKTGCGFQVLLNILLWILGWIPGVVHSYYVIYKYPERF